MFQEGVGMNYYPGQTVAPFSDPTMAGFNMLQGRAGGTPQQAHMGGYIGNSMANNATDALSATAYGGFLGGNPYLDSLYDKGAQDITDRFNNEMLPGLNATFGAGSRSGSRIQSEMMGDLAGETMGALGGLHSSIYAPAYESERDRMMQAAGGLSDQAIRAAALTPGYDQMGRQNITDLLNVGGAMEDQTQRLMDAEREKFEFGQQAPWETLGNYANVAYGLPGGYGTQTTEQGSGSRLAGGIGGAMAGAGLAGSVAALNPYMWPMVIGGGMMGMM